ncbi:MAG: SGNH/GDSL hydrolase family protein [Candidatus Omnitrophica bacterium]|nr:SGNH/GDSL hydrolase family protein [Candidatus Omnitrophota bacterium]
MSSKSFLHGYTSFAIFFLNIFLLLVLSNVLIYAFHAAVRFQQGDKADIQGVYKKYKDRLPKVYPERNQSEIAHILSETWNRPLAYEPFTEFKEAPFSGQYIRVDSNGFRVSKGQGPWPPLRENFNIFILGGSTAFNYGVSDEETIASYLQEILASEVPGKRVFVYNFARGFYYSTQERILFEQLLLAGHIPDIALFIDGINDTSILYFFRVVFTVRNLKVNSK